MASVEWDPKAYDFLKKLPNEIARRIYKKVDSEVMVNPKRYLETLVGVEGYKMTSSEG